LIDDRGNDHLKSQLTPNHASRIMKYSQPAVAISDASAHMIVILVPRVIPSTRGDLLPDFSSATLGSSDCKVGISRFDPGLLGRSF
jgi:hypothetical protein